MSLTVLLLSFVGLVFAALGASYFMIFRKDTAKGDDVAEIQAIGLRAVGRVAGSPLANHEESMKRLLGSGSNGIVIGKPKVRHKTQEFDQVSHKAVLEVLETIHGLIADCKDRLKHFDNVAPDALYASTRELSSSIVFAKHLVSELEERAELVKKELSGDFPNHKKAYETGTARLVLRNDSVNTLILDRTLEPIRWTLLGDTVKDVLNSLDAGIRELQKSKLVNQYR